MQETPSSNPGSGRSPGEGIGYPLQYYWASLVAQTIKNPPAVQETWVQSLGWKDLVSFNSCIGSWVLYHYYYLKSIMYALINLFI